MLPLERGRSLSKSYEVIKAHIQERGWTLDFDRHGEGIVTTNCTIRYASGAVVNTGFGRGDGDLSTVAAMSQALEHHFGVMENIDLKVTCVKAGEIHGDPRFSTLPFLSEFHMQRERQIACAVYEDFHSGAAVLIPLFLIFPHYALFERVEGDNFDYSLVLRFGSNSGTAIGASFDEAAIHALNEIVERDAWSLFLLSHFMDTNHKIGRVIDVGGMPDELQHLLEVASERASGRGIVLVDITSDIGIPTFVATVDCILAGEPVYPYGFGTSSYPCHAVYRAVTELIQAIDLKGQSDDAAGSDRLSLELVSNYPKIRDCVYFEVDPNRLEHGAWEYAEQPIENLAVVLADILYRLRTRGIDVCFNVNHAVADTICVVSCVSMALERFFLVTEGHLMGPGRRGMRLFADGEKSVREEDRAEA